LQSARLPTTAFQSRPVHRNLIDPRRNSRSIGDVASVKSRWFPRTGRTSIMRKLELERLLEKAVADGLGVALPKRAHRRVPAKLPRHALPRRARAIAAAPRHNHHIAEHV
jgi:hypothetical protein